MDFSSIKENENFIRFLMEKKQLPLVNPKTDDDKKLLKVCQDFESIFVQQLLKEMRKTVPKDGFLPESNEQSIYKSMFDEEIANKIAGQGTLGLAETLFEQIRDKSKDKKFQPDGVDLNGKKYIEFKRDN